MVFEYIPSANTWPNIKKVFSLKKYTFAIYLSYAILVSYVAYVVVKLFQLPWRDFLKLYFTIFWGSSLKKSRIRETKNLSTDADSSTDTTVGWTKNSQKPKFFEKRKKSSKTQKVKKV